MNGTPTRNALRQQKRKRSWWRDSKCCSSNSEFLDRMAGVMSEEAPIDYKAMENL